MKISKGLKLEPHASPKPWPMQFPMAGGGVVGWWVSGWSFIGCIHPCIKLIHPRWQPTAKGRKTRCILFTSLPQLPTLLAGLSVTDYSFTAPLYPFSLTHSTHMPSFLHPHTFAHTNKPIHAILPAGNLYRFHSEKATTPQFVLRALLLMYTGCPLWLHSSEAPHIHWAQNTLKAVTHTGNYTRAGLSYVYTHEKSFYLVFLFINEWTGEWGFWAWRQHLSWLSNSFMQSGVITYQSSKQKSLSLVSCTSPCHHLHSW